MNPSIAAIIPAFNLEGQILRSIASVLAQTSRPEEVIVVDDGSTDATLAAARTAAGGHAFVRVLARPHMGPGAARNAGVAATTSDWVAFLDGDDAWQPSKVKRLRKAIASHPEADMVAHDVVELGLDGSNTERPLHEHYDPSRMLFGQLYRGNFLATSALAVKRRIIEEVGGFDSGLPSAQDYDLWLRISRRGRLLFIPEALTTYVMRRGSISANYETRRNCMLRIGRRYEAMLGEEEGRFAARLARLRFTAGVEKEHLLETFRRGDLWRALVRAPRIVVTMASALCDTTRPESP